MNYFIQSWRDITDLVNRHGTNLGETRFSAKAGQQLEKRTRVQIETYCLMTISPEKLARFGASRDTKSSKITRYFRTTVTFFPLRFARS